MVDLVELVSLVDCFEDVKRRAADDLLESVRRKALEALRTRNDGWVQIVDMYRDVLFFVHSVQIIKSLSLLVLAVYSLDVIVWWLKAGTIWCIKNLLCTGRPNTPSLLSACFSDFLLKSKQASFAVLWVLRYVWLTKVRSGLYGMRHHLGW